MGGLAFSQTNNGQPALHTPRMPPDVYYAEKFKYLALLGRFFEKTTSPAEAPGKVDYGDIDILVERQRYNFTVTNLAGALHAVRHVSNGVTTSFAVPYPGHDDIFIQLDVHVCNLGLIEWTSFLNSYGDLTQIIGVTLRNVGLTATDRGLHLCVADTEGANQKASRILLTSTPEDVMAFLGLDGEAYSRGFATEEEIFRWCAAGRFFRPDLFRKKVDNAKDRQRLKKRPMFGRLVREWLPAHPEYDDRKVPTRDEVLEEVFRTFGVRKEYEKCMERKVLHSRENALFRQLASVIPLTGDKLNLVVRGLRRWVYLENGAPVLSDQPDMKNEGRHYWTSDLSEPMKEALATWIFEHWAEIKSREQHRINHSKSERKAERSGVTS